jgi:hypothetical protein
MHFSTIALGLAALAQQAAPASPAGAESADYVILAGEAGRARLERLIAGRPASARPLRESPAGGMGLVSCVTAWRGDPPQTDDCLASRLARQGPGAIVLNAYHPGAARDGLTVTCHGPGGTGRAVFGPRPRRRDSTALETCLERGLARSTAPVRQRVGVGWSDRLAVEDVEEARSTARSVLLVAIDHVGVPRGVTGTCLIQGRVVRQERGSGIRTGALVGAGIPCGSQPHGGGKTRRIWMGAMRQGGFGRLYLGDRNRVAHFEAADR